MPLLFYYTKPYFSILINLFIYLIKNINTSEVLDIFINDNIISTIILLNTHLISYCVL
jgi:hypothetical protein